MNGNELAALFPFIPIIGIIITLFFQYALKIDISKTTVLLFTCLQTAAAVLLAVWFVLTVGPGERIIISVSQWDLSIQFALEMERIWLLMAFIPPLVFTLFRPEDLKTPAIRIIFLFYLTACSGIILTADVFNYFVFFELMIMAAYVLIASKQQYFASIKYMLIGSFSSVLFLAGIIVLYASGAGFSFAGLAAPGRLPVPVLRPALVFFTPAFLIKTAIFPGSSWLPACHAASTSTVSAFLSAFSLITGFFGLYFICILPAQQAGFTRFFTILEITALVTMVTAAVFIFTETDYKRCIAGSSAFASAFIGFLFATGEFELAWLYIPLHAMYKSGMFHLSGRIEQSALSVRSRAIVFIAFGFLLLFISGIFPSISHFFKQGLSGKTTAFTVITTGAAVMIIGGFAKFRIVIPPKIGHSSPEERRHRLFPGFLLAVVLVYYAFFLFPGTGIRYLTAGPVDLLKFSRIKYYIPEMAAVPAGVLLGRVVFPRFGRFSNVDTRFVFRNLNWELGSGLILTAALLVAFLL